MQVEAMFRAPLKSARLEPIQSTDIDESGIAGDRRLMAVSEDGQMLSLRQCRSLLTIRARLQGDTVTFDAPRRTTYTHVVSDDGRRVQTELFGTNLTGHDQGDELANWMTEALGRPVRVVVQDVPFSRVTPPGTEHLGPAKHARFYDMGSLHLITNASHATLSESIGTPVDFRRFRPNIVVSGSKPFEEHLWKSVQIGNQVFDYAGFCERCIATRIDPETQAIGEEPLLTLSQTRRLAGGLSGKPAPAFGIYLRPRSNGSIAAGSRLKVIERFENPPPNRYVNSPD